MESQSFLRHLHSASSILLLNKTNEDGGAEGQGGGVTCPKFHRSVPRQDSHGGPFIALRPACVKGSLYVKHSVEQFYLKYLTEPSR